MLRSLFVLKVICHLLFPYTLYGEMKTLHLTFHRGCAYEFSALFEVLGRNLDTINLSKIPLEKLDPLARDPAELYNIDHARAERMWEAGKDLFNQYDVILTSDTTALSRIFLQNPYKGILIIWVTNRFNYREHRFATKYPDDGYYELLNAAKNRPNVFVVSSCDFETHYAKQFGVDLGKRVINACGARIEEPMHPIIPEVIRKQKRFFIPAYHNETEFLSLPRHLGHLGIPHYQGGHTSPRELENFRGVIHLPYSYTTIALFMNTQLGLPYFIPSKKLMKKMLRSRNYWHQDCTFLKDHDRFDLSEFYAERNRDYFVYFDSFNDLQKIIAKADLDALQQRVRRRAELHRREMLSRWNQLFEEIERTQKI